MNMYPRCTRVVFGALICLLLSAPALTTEALAASKKQAPPAQTAASENPEDLNRRLVEFGKTIAESYNRCALPNINKKAVSANGDGTFTAHYMAIDPQSIRGSHKPSINPQSPVKYIGTLNYDEVKYSCTAKSKADALKGPFSGSRTPTTELVKYMNGKWSY